ncbi:hypothetical protein [Malacoplasma muris]|uniref:hypothetical protein n=1 Tax=Malacoplasma muris TaxID=2119 RepID=UPI00398E3AAF
MEINIKKNNMISKINLEKNGIQSGDFIKNQLINFIKEAHICSGEEIIVSIQEDQNELQLISICGKIKIIKGNKNMRPNTNQLILQQLEKINNTIGNIETKINEMDNRISNIEVKINEMDNRITVIENKIDEMDKRITVIENKIDYMDKRITVIENKIDEMDNRITVIETKIDSINDEIIEIKDRLTKIESCPTIKKELSDINNK